MSDSLNECRFSVFLSHRNEEYEKYIFKLIRDSYNTVSIQLFNSVEDLRNITCSLIIIDVDFISERFDCLKKLMSEHHDKETSYLIFIPTDLDIEEENKLLELVKINNVVVDFLKETNFNEICLTDFIILNRVKILLKFSELCLENLKEQSKIKEHLWNVLDYSNFFVVILDSELNIRLVNFHLSKELGYPNPDLLIGESWKNFIKPKDLSSIEFVHHGILDKSLKNNEFTNDLINKNGVTIPVKWFNSLINDNFNCTFSIGIPLKREPTIDEDIDSIRTYFRDIVEKDKTVIEAMKYVTFQNGKRIRTRDFETDFNRRKNDNKEDTSEF